MVKKAQKITLKRYMPQLVVLDPSAKDGYATVNGDISLWYNPEAYTIPIPKLLMNNTIRCGYFTAGELMYPISSVLQVKFVEMDAKDFVKDDYINYDYSDEEIKSLIPWREY